MYFNQTIERVSAVLPTSLSTVCVLLDGVLGAGKTTFVQEYLSTLGLASEQVQSPTFLKALEYELPNGTTVLHMDCYRMDDAEEIPKLGLETFRPAKLWLIEWPGLFLQALAINPSLVSLYGLHTSAVHVRIDLGVGGERRIQIENKNLSAR